MQATRASYRIRAGRHLGWLLPLIVAGCTSQAASQPASSVPITIKGYTVYVELATTEPAWELGLMNRTSMPADRGMLFVFDSARLQAFWMKDTQLPLSIAFIDQNKVITDIQDMAPMDETTIHRSSRPVPYALEVNQGWFAGHGIAVGDRCTFSVPEQPAGR